MSTANDNTTLVCLFHDAAHAKQVLHELQSANVPTTATTVIGGDTARTAQHASLEEYGIPTRDLTHLEQGLEAGGTIVIVNAMGHEASIVESIFARGRAAKIDETVAQETAPIVAPPIAAVPSTGAAIPIVEEELEVGKRAVDRGGVRVFTRVAEVPAEASVVLHEEHAVVERSAVNRPATDADLAQSNRSITLTETAEEAVVGKTARVVEEIRLSKEMTEHTEQIHDTVRKTEVEVDELTADNARLPGNKTL